MAHHAKPLGGAKDAWPNGAVGLYMNAGTYGTLAGSVDENNQGLHQPIHYDGNTSQFVLFTPQKAGTLHVRWLGAAAATSFWVAKGSSTATEDRVKTFSASALQGEDTFAAQAGQQYGIWLNATGACRYLFLWLA